jgi:predicted nucleic acid-binding protein
MNDANVFVDTNILVYAYDASAGAKHDVAMKIMRELWDSGRGTISMQVLQEFFVTVTSKIAKPLDIKTARDVVRDLIKWNPILVNGDIIINAIDIHSASRYSFWDSLIIAAAIEAGVDTLYSEDLSDKQRIKNITIKNPFKSRIR